MEAFNIEISSILSYGRIDIGTGILTNLTDGGGGLTGIVFTEEIRKMLSEQKIGIKNPMNNPKHRAKVRRVWTEEEKRKLSLSKRNISNETRTKLSEAGKGKAKTLGIKHSEETKKKMRLNNSGEKNPFYGKKHSDETKEKMKGRESSKGFLGKKHSDETKEKIRLAKLGKPSNSKGSKGYKFTNEQRQRMSLAIKNHWETRRELK